MYSFFMDSGDYTGDISETGKREGKGTCQWVDGSIYIGEWKDGMRHGKGIYTLADGTRYEGMWVEDRKQGEGELMLNNKEIIRCTWDNDRINGEGTFDNGNGKVIPAIWHYDMMIPKGDQGGICSDMIPLQILLFLGVITFIVLGFVLEPVYFYGIIPCALLSWLESFFCSKTLKYAQHPLPLKDVKANINRMKQTRIRIIFHIQNYHYKIVVTHWTDNKGRRHTRRRRVRVNTHYACREMVYSQWADSAPPAESM